MDSPFLEYDTKSSLHFCFAQDYLNIREYKIISEQSIHYFCIFLHSTFYYLPEILTSISQLTCALDIFTLTVLHVSLFLTRVNQIFILVRSLSLFLSLFSNRIHYAQCQNAYVNEFYLFSFA